MKPKKITDDMMRGSLVDILKQPDDKELQRHCKDMIPLILKDDLIKYHFANECERSKKLPVVVMREAVEYYLKNNPNAGLESLFEDWWNLGGRKKVK